MNKFNPYTLTKGPGVHPKLYVFDADGTLIDRKTGEFLTNRLRHLQLIADAGIPVAIATNQGGPACRDAGWDWSHKYPTLAQVEKQYGDLAKKIGAKLYMALAYRTQGGNWYEPKGVSESDPRLNRFWRKPGPGMIVQAADDHGVTIDEIMFVGDRPEDEAAAEAAGCHFKSASEFFLEVGS